MDWSLFILIFTGVFGVFIGYLLGRNTKNKNPHAFSDSVWQNKVAKLENDLKMCQAARQLILFNAEKAAVVFGSRIIENDLTIIKGIDLKTATLLQNNGFKTWKILSETSVEIYQDILDAAGNSFKTRNPGTWPEQAKLAYEGNWKALREWQKKL